MGLSEGLMSKCSEHLSAYKSACEEHPYLKAFDAKLQQRTNQLIDALTVEDNAGKLSQHAVHMEVSKHLLDVTQGVANFITESKTDVGNNEALRSLVNAYFDNTIEILKIFNNIAICIENAEMGQHLIQEAVVEFDKESAETDTGGKKKKYEKTLKNLKAFKAMGDPFSVQVLTGQFEMIQMQQDYLLKEVILAKEKIEQEISVVEENIIVVNAVFGAALAAALAASIALFSTYVMFRGAGIAMGLVAILLEEGWAVAYALMEEKRNELEDLKKEEDVRTSVDQCINTDEEATKTVSMLVKGVEDKIIFMLKLVDNAIEIEENEKAMGCVLNLLRDKVEQLTKKLKEVGESVEENSKMFAEARLQV